MERPLISRQSFTLGLLYHLIKLIPFEYKQGDSSSRYVMMRINLAQYNMILAACFDPKGNPVSFLSDEEFKEKYLSYRNTGAPELPLSTCIINKYVTGNRAAQKILYYMYDKFSENYVPIDSLS